LVHEPAEHHVRHALELSLDGFADMRMVVAVARGPPGRRAVDEHAPVVEHDPRPPGTRGGERRGRRLHLRIRPTRRRLVGGAFGILPAGFVPSRHAADGTGVAAERAPQLPGGGPYTAENPFV